MPGPAPSKSNGGLAGLAKIFLWSSVITQPRCVPLPPEGVTLIGSGLPSTQREVRSEVVIVPPSTLQVVVGASLMTVIKLVEMVSQSPSVRLEIGSPGIGSPSPL